MNGFTEIIIYKDCKIQPNKNFKVDNLESYLATLQTYNKVVGSLVVPIKSQLMKHALKHTYKLTMVNENQDGAGDNSAQGFLSFDSIFNYNYLSATNYNQNSSGDWDYASTKVYYFIKNKKWLSQSAIELELEMDVINTLIDNEFNNTGHLTLSEKTMILRQHKNRWKNGTSPRQFKPIIDLYSEGINPVLFKKKEDTLFADIGEADENNYYLVYKANQTGDNQPLDVFLCSDSPFQVDNGTSGWNGTFDATELGGKYASLIYGADTYNNYNNVGCKVSFEDKQGNDRTFTISATDECILIYKDGLSNAVWVLYGRVSATGFATINGYRTKARLHELKEGIAITGLFKMRVGDRKTIYGDFTPTIYGTNPSITPTYISGLGIASAYTPPASRYEDVNTIFDIDRTDPTLVKIVKLPYCPLALNLSSGKATLPSGWEIGDYDSGTRMIHCRNSNSIVCLDSDYFEVSNEDNSLESPYYDLRQRGINEAVNLVPKSADFETKLLNSEFYLKKFVYDSFAYDFRLELYNVIDYSQSFYIKQITSMAISSNFAFKFFESEFTDDEEQNGRSIDVDNYSNLLFVNRNNEVVLYNSNYLNYIRSGYNFDIKTRNRQLTANIIGGVISTAGAVVSAVAGGPIGVAGAVGLGVSAVSKFTNTIVSVAQSDQNIAEKLRSAELQGVSVAGADSLDIMTSYTNGNKAKLVKYEVSPKMKKAVFDLLYYTGYVAGFQGIPDTTSRMWFNFVQAQPVFTNMQNFPDDLITALFNKYNEGITFLHRQGWENAYLWDFEQEHENWEISLRQQRVQTATISTIVKNREYVINPTGPFLPGRLIDYNNKLIWRLRQKSNMMVVEEITDLSQYNVITLNQTIVLFKSGVNVKVIPFADYDQNDFYWTIELSDDNTTPSGLELNAMASLMGYVID